MLQNTTQIKDLVQPSQWERLLKYQPSQLILEQAKQDLQDNQCLLTQKEIDEATHRFETQSDLVRIKRNGDFKYSIIKAKNGDLFALYKGKEFKIGKGEDGIVKLAQNIKSKEFCCVKISKVNVDDDDAQPADKESKFVAQNNMLHGFQFRKVQDKQCRAYIFMDLVLGLTLKSFLAQEMIEGYRMTNTEKLTLLLKILENLRNLKRNRILHTDLHQENILINPVTQQVFFIDFSRALFVSKDKSRRQSIFTRDSSKCLLDLYAVMEKIPGVSTILTHVLRGFTLDDSINMNSYRYSHAIKDVQDLINACNAQTPCKGLKI